MNTAQLRNLASEAEKRLDWSEAAKLYDQAVKVYPFAAHPGSLYELDIKNLTISAKSCAKMAQENQQ